MTQNVSSRIPLEDVREIWYWGSWKEPVPDGFNSSVVIVCTSREKCQAYLASQNHDFWLDEDRPMAGAATNVRDAARTTGGSRFRLISFSELITALTHEVARCRPRTLTLLVNPRQTSGEVVTADGIDHVDAFLRACGVISNSEA